jgi:hypothetical protein
MAYSRQSAPFLFDHVPTFIRGLAPWNWGGFFSVHREKPQGYVGKYQNQTWEIPKVNGD